MDFKRTELCDVDKIKPFFSYFTARTCDFTVGGMFMWRDHYRMEHAIDGGVFFSRLKSEAGKVYYNVPLGEDAEKAIRRNVEACGSTVSFCTVPEEYLPIFKRLYPDCTVTQQIDYSDYFYSAKELIMLSGKKFSPQRNLISQFKRNHSQWEFVPIRQVGADAAKRFLIGMNEKNTKTDTPTKNVEGSMAFEVLDNIDAYGMIGGCLIASGEIVGFSLGEVSKDTLFVHIEKADRDCKGAYQLLMNCFAAEYGENAEFINREEDMGDEGLRRSKQAYNPICLLKKYIVEI